MKRSSGTAPFFSIIVPTYNQSQYLPHALDSLISQTFENWEALIVNDGSTDDTASVGESYSRRDGRFRVFHKTNGGVASALNAGLSQATGDWICWLSSDDLFEPEKLRIHLDAIHKHPEIFFFYTHFYYLDDKTGVKSSPDPWNAIPDRGFQVSRFFSGPYIHGNSIAIHRKVFERVGFFDDSYPHGQDFEMWLRISSKYESMYINQRTCVTRWHATQTTHEFPEAGFFDSARAVIEYINNHSFTELFPLQELNDPGQAVSAIIETIDISIKNKSLIHTFGPCSAFLFRLKEWLYSNSDSYRKSLIKIILSILNDKDKFANVHSVIREALYHLEMNNGYSYKKSNFVIDSTKYMRELKSLGNVKKSESISRYLELVRKKNRFEGKSNIEYWKKIQEKMYFEKHHCYGKNHNGLALFGDDVDRIKKYTQLSNNMKIVVIGCGYGRESVLIAPHVEHVYGIDVSDTILHKAKMFAEKNGIRNFTPILVDKWKSLVPHDIDVVYCMVVFQHLTRDLVKDYIAGLAKKLSKKGVFVCQFADLIYGTDDAELKEYEPSVRWCKDDIIHLVQEHGLYLYKIDTYEIPGEGHWHWAFFGNNINKEEKKRRIVNYDRQAHSVDCNIAKWSKHDWSHKGHYWSGAWGGSDNLWNYTIFPRLKNFYNKEHVLEIAPGYGRWTHYLLRDAQVYSGVDFLEKCILECKNEFKNYKNAFFYQNDGRSLHMIDDDSVSFVFSWDSFVHMDYETVDNYLQQISQKLRIGGHGFIHHSNFGEYRKRKCVGDVRNDHWRSEDMTANLFHKTCKKYGLQCLIQEKISWGADFLNDCITIIQKEGSVKHPVVLDNYDFMEESENVINETVRSSYDSFHKKINLVKDTQRQILLVCDYFWPFIGGVESYVEDLGVKLLNHGFNVEVCARYTEFRKKNEVNGLKIHHFKCEGDIYSGFTGDIDGYQNFILQSNYDAVIILSQPDNWASVLIAQVKHKIRSKIFFLPSINWCDRERWHRRKVDETICEIIKLFDIVITVTEDGHDVQYTRLHDIQSVYIPHSIEIEPEHINIRQQFSVSDEKPLLVMVANFWPVKNHEELITSFQQTQFDWRLLIIGYAVDVHRDYFDRIKALAAKDSRIILCAGMKRKLAAAAIAQADLLVVPSKAESAGPLVIQQAMSHGVPWVATYNCNGVHHQAGGIIADMDRFMSVADVLIRKPEIRLELSRQGKAQYNSNYTWDKTIQAFLALLDDTLVESKEFKMPEQIRRQKNALQDAVLELSMLSRPAPKTLLEIQNAFPKIMVPNNKFGMSEVNGILGFLEDKEMLYLYNMAADLPRGGVILEVGSFMGLSAYIMASSLVESGNYTARIHCIDWWTSFKDKINPEYRGFYSVHNFLGNLISKGLNAFIRPRDKESLLSAQDFEDNSIDVVFIDGDHSFMGCYNDLVAWYPKVKFGGFLIGHDYTWTPSVQEAVHTFTRENNLEFMPPPEGTSIFRIDKRKPESLVPGNDELTFSVIVTTCNRRNTLEKCLHALDMQNFDSKDFEVIVCDDGSTDDTQSFVNSFNSKYILKYFRQDNRGPAAARNMGLLAARGKYVLFLNDDSILSSNGLSIHHDIHLQHQNEKIAVLGKFSLCPEYQNSAMGVIIENSNVLFNFYNKIDRNLYNYHSFFTCNISLRKQAIFDIGLFDESFTAPAAEDIDLGFRLFHQGWRVLYAADCVAWHDHSLSIRDFCNIHNLRGYWRVSMFYKHKSPELKWFNDAEYKDLKQNTINSKEAGERIENIVNYVEKINMISTKNGGDLVRIAQELFPLVKEIQFHFEVKGYSSNPWFDVVFSPLYKDNPLVSVVIPCFNHEKYLTECVESVVSQTFQDFEIIIVNDGSTDKSLDVAYTLYKKYSRHRIRIINQVNSGQPAIPRNNGILVALGQYVLPLDSDDYLLPDALESLVNEANRHHGKEVVVYGAMQKFGLHKNIWPTKPLDPILLPRQNQLPNTSLYSRSLWEKVGGYNTNVPGYEDWDFWIGVHCISQDFYFLNKVILMYRTTDNNSMYDSAKKRHELNFANIIKNNAINYSNIEIDWSKSYLINHHLLNEVKRKNKHRVDYSIVYAFIILNSFPGIYTKDDIQWATRQLFPNQDKIESFNEIRIKTEKDINATLFVCHNFPPYNTAGAQLFALNMAKKLKTLGHDVSFFYPVDISKRQPGEDKTPYAVVSTEYEGLKVHQINVVDGSTNLFENPQYMFANETVEQQFEELLRREQFDLVHFHLLYRLSSRLPLAAKSLNIPTAATLHDYWLLCAMGHLIDTKGRECSGPESPEKCARCLGGFQADPSKGIVEFFRLRQQVNLAGYEALDRKYSPSKHLADVHARYGFSRPAVLPLGWPAVQAPRTNPAQKDKIVLGFIGQIVYRKGLDLLVKALNGLDAILRDKCELHIHGTVQQPQFYDTVMDTVKDNPVVKFFGPYKQDDLGSILSSFDVTVIPSRQENYPLTVLESLSAKVPVIASDVGGVREMFQDKVEGFLFPREDTTRLAKIIRMLLTQPDLLASMRTKIRPIKTMRQNAEEYARVYEEMMKT